MSELKITIPEGMKIDLDNSVLTGDSPIIKFKSKSISYKDIMTNSQEGCYTVKNSNRIYAANLKQAEKLIAIQKLMNIAYYYNAKSGKVIDWDKQQIKYYIYFHNCYCVSNVICVNFGSVYFLNKEDAQLVIDNPNFRDILDTIYKN